MKRHPKRPIRAHVVSDLAQALLDQTKHASELMDRYPDPTERTPHLMAYLPYRDAIRRHRATRAEKDASLRVWDRLFRAWLDEECDRECGVSAE